MANKTSKKEEEDARIAGAGLGGVLLGASLGGPPGALIGGIIGIALGVMRNEELKKKGK